MGGSGRQYRSPAHAASLIRPALETDYNGIERARAVPRVVLMREPPLVLDGSTALCANGRRSLALSRGAQVLTGAGLAPAYDEEHARRQVPPPGALHRHSVGALTSRAAFPATTSAFAIACQQQLGDAESG